MESQGGQIFVAETEQHQVNDQMGLRSSLLPRVDESLPLGVPLNLKENPNVLRYAWTELKIAINHGRLLGSGGLGSVTQGWVYANNLKGAPSNAKGATRVAIKVMHDSGLKGQTRLANEMKYLIKYQHENLIRVLGYSSDSNEKGLVYEYAINGSLDKWLFSGEEEYSKLLTWNQRMKIAIGIARGMHFLHSRDPPIMCCNARAANVLLDEKLNAKLADFGLTDHLKTHGSGTWAYRSPTYSDTDIINTRSDIYSYGVVLVELLTGKMASDGAGNPKLRLEDWARQKLEKLDDILQIVDGRLKGVYSKKRAFLIATLAKLCIQDKIEEMPCMGDILEALESFSEWIPKAEKRK